MEVEGHEEMTPIMELEFSDNGNEEEAPHTMSATSKVIEILVAIVWVQVVMLPMPMRVVVKE